MRTITLWALSLVVAACGGKVQDGGDPEPGQPTAPNDDRGGESGDGENNGDDGDDIFTPTDLPPCEEGVPRREAAECPWITPDGRCYETKIAACACLCRGTGGKTCSSGFPGGPTGAVEVACF